METFPIQKKSRNEPRKQIKTQRRQGEHGRISHKEKRKNQAKDEVRSDASRAKSKELPQRKKGLVQRPAKKSERGA